MKIIVAGGRDFIPNDSHREWLLNILKKTEATHIVCGMARGADMFGYQIAKELGLEVLEFPADWDRFGKSAGYKRNIEMAEIADGCILFPGGKGTQHMRDIAKKKRLEIWSWNQPDN